MNDLPTMEFHILNFFVVKNDFASTVEMNEDFKRSGIPTAGIDFQKILDNDYLDRDRLNGRFAYKINEYGRARWKRLKNQYEPENNNKMPFNIKNFRIDLEELLIENPETIVDLLPIIRKYCEGKSRNEIHDIKATQISQEIARLKKLGHIEISDEGVGDLSNASWMSDEKEIPIKGTYEFYNKKAVPIVQHFHQITHGPNSPIAGHDLTMGDIKSNEENPESIQLARKGYKLNIWILIFAIIAIGVTIAIYLLSQHTPK